MRNTLQPSPMIVAIDLIRVNVDALSIEELEAHALRMDGILLALAHFIEGAVGGSPDEIRNVIKLTRDLRARILHVRNLIGRHIDAMETNHSSDQFAGVSGYTGARSRHVPFSC